MSWALAFAGGLFLGILGMQHVGHRIAMRRMALDPEGANKGAGGVEGAIFGLLSLLVSEAAARDLGAWVVAGHASPTTVAAILSLPAVNQMMETTTTRRMATQVHPPPIVFAMLAVMALIGALLAG